METDVDQDEQVRAELLAASADAMGTCGVARTLQVLDGKWTTLIVRDLLTGAKRFSELRAALGNVSAKTLTDRLRALEHQGILTRTVYAEIPPRVVYELTGQGQSLQTVLHAMLLWGRDHPITQ
jgi:DNA-binding HxlR family transcriptional regulator